MLLLVLDGSVRTPIRLLDLVLPLQVAYGTVAIGLGTLSFDILVLVAVTGWPVQCGVSVGAVRSRPGQVVA